MVDDVCSMFASSQPPQIQTLLGFIHQLHSSNYILAVHFRIPRSMHPVQMVCRLVDIANSAAIAAEYVDYDVFATRLCACAIANVPRTRHYSIGVDNDCSYLRALVVDFQALSLMEGNAQNSNWRVCLTWPWRQHCGWYTSNPGGQIRWRWAWNLRRRTCFHTDWWRRSCAFHLCHDYVLIDLMSGAPWFQRSCDPSNYPHHRILPWMYFSYCVLPSTLGTFTCACTAFGSVMDYDAWKVFRTDKHYGLGCIDCRGSILVWRHCICAVYHGGNGICLTTKGICSAELFIYRAYQRSYMHSDYTG